jgi:DNA-binding NarL/FixJ family response regulator
MLIVANDDSHTCHNLAPGATEQIGPSPRTILRTPESQQATVIRPRVLLAYDHRLVREALAQLLQPGCEVVGTVADGRALLDAILVLRPDVVVLDIAMPLLNGLDATRQLKRLMPEVQVIFLTVSEAPDLVAEAFRAGASGYLLKNSAASELWLAIRDVCAGRSYVTPLVTRGRVSALIQGTGSTRKPTDLSPRQRQVLRLLAEGRSMKQIARALKITARTVAFHKYGMMQELGIRTSAELVTFAARQHLVTV